VWIGRSTSNIPVERLWCSVGDWVIWPLRLRLVAMQLAGELNLADDRDFTATQRVVLSYLNDTFARCIPDWNSRYLPGPGTSGAEGVRIHRSGTNDREWKGIPLPFPGAYHRFNWGINERKGIPIPWQGETRRQLRGYGGLAEVLQYGIS